MGVTQGGNMSAQLVSFFVDVGEVRKFVDKAVEAAGSVLTAENPGER
jgi:hypothetical protein